MFNNILYFFSFHTNISSSKNRGSHRKSENAQCHECRRWLARCPKDASDTVSRMRFLSPAARFRYLGAGVASESLNNKDAEIR
jgi:hypothetical protein